MKPRIFEKSGLPNSLGMIMIVMIIGLMCLVQCIFIQPVHAQKKPDLEYILVEPEPEIQIEAWMFDPNSWNNGTLAGYPVKEPDPEITIESWMTDFSIPALASAGEREYEIEAWMYEEDSWIHPESNLGNVNESQANCY